MPEEDRIELTNILSYLDSTSSLGYIKWLPEGFEVYKDLESTFGFKPTYPSGRDYGQYYNVNSMRSCRSIYPGYDVSVNIFSGRYMETRIKRISALPWRGMNT